MNQYGKYHGFNPGVVTGKPVELYGLPGRDEATGRGVGIIVLKLLEKLGRKPQETRVAIQGFGNVGTHTAKYLHEHQCSIVAVSGTAGGFYRPSGLNLKDALAYVAEHGNLPDYKGGEHITNEQVLELDVELLVPAALGGVVTGENAAADQSRHDRRRRQRTGASRC